MSELMLWRRRLSTIGFGLAIGLLLLPLTTISACGQTQSASGADLAVVAPSLVAHHVWYPGGWAYLLFDLVPIIATAGLIIQAFRGRHVASATLGLSVVAFAALVADGFIFPRAGQGAGSVTEGGAGIAVPTLMIIFGQSWHWQPAFYAATAAVLLPAFPSVAELIVVRGRTDAAPGSVLVVSARVGGMVALVGVLATIAASWLPYEHLPNNGGAATYPSIFNAGFPGSQWFAVEPVAVAALGTVASLVLIARAGQTPSRFAAGILFALGVQTFSLFLGYAATGPYGGTTSQIGIGSVVGMIGGLWLLAGGAIAIARLGSSDRSGAAISESAAAPGGVAIVEGSQT